LPSFYCFCIDGETISIDRKKKEQFEQNVLPKYFHHSNMATFVRQLNNYGFKKSAKDSSKLEFENDYFLRNHPEQYWKIRNRRKRHKEKQEKNANTDVSNALLNLRGREPKIQRIVNNHSNFNNKSFNALQQNQALAHLLGQNSLPHITPPNVASGVPNHGQGFSTNSRVVGLSNYIQQPGSLAEKSKSTNGPTFVSHSTSSKRIGNLLNIGQHRNNFGDTTHSTYLPIPGTNAGATGIQNNSVQLHSRLPTSQEINTVTKTIHLLDGIDFRQDSNVLREQINHKILDFASPTTESVMNTVAHVAREIAQTKIGLVNFLDTAKQVMHGNSGSLEYMNACEFKNAICKTTIRDDCPNIYIIPDCTKDDTVKDNPLVTEYPNVRFYAGAPIIYTDKETRRKIKLGAVCVLDDKPCEIDGRVKNCLLWLANLVSDLVEEKLCYIETIQTENGIIRHVIQNHRAPRLHVSKV
jgi:hypothetical protein